MLRRISSLTSRSMRASSSARDRRRLDEVEAQAIGRDQRAGLLDVRPEHLAQRGVQQVRRRCDCGGWRRDASASTASVTAAPVVEHARCSTRTRCARGPPGDDADHAVDGRRARRRASMRAGIGHLAAGFEIERRAIGDDEARARRRPAPSTCVRVGVEERDNRGLVDARRRRSPRSDRASARRAARSASDAKANAAAFFCSNALPARAALALRLHRALVALAIDARAGARWRDPR